MSELAPGSEAEVIAAIREACDARAPLAVQGNATLAAMLRPVQAARTLSMRNLSGITLYAPKELVIRAGAGTPLSQIEAAVSEQNQMLIAEPPDFSSLFGTAPPTLGGVVGANLSGPRRIARGATRDHVLGVRAVNGEGEVIRSGGRVLKNVTGLDLCKLLCGSHGTLAVLTEITMKVLPRPEAVATVMVPGLDVRAAVGAMSAALGSPYDVSAAAFLPAAAASRVGLNGAATLARIEEFAPSVAYRTERLRGELAAFGPAEILDQAASLLLWRAFAMPPRLVLRPGRRCGGSRCVPRRHRAWSARWTGSAFFSTGAAGWCGPRPRRARPRMTGWRRPRAPPAGSGSCSAAPTTCAPPSP